MSNIDRFELLYLAALAYFTARLWIKVSRLERDTPPPRGGKETKP